MSRQQSEHDISSGYLLERSHDIRVFGCGGLEERTRSAPPDRRAAQAQSRREVSKAKPTLYLSPESLDSLRAVRLCGEEKLARHVRWLLRLRRVTSAERRDVNLPVPTDLKHVQMWY